MFSVAKQLCWEEELYHILSSDDIRNVNGQLPFYFEYWLLFDNGSNQKKIGLIQLAIEGGASIAIFVRCFADKKGMEMELQRRFHIEFPREVLATITVSFS